MGEQTNNDQRNETPTSISRNESNQTNQQPIPPAPTLHTRHETFGVRAPGSEPTKKV